MRSLMFFAASCLVLPGLACGQSGKSGDTVSTEASKTTQASLSPEARPLRPPRRAKATGTEAGEDLPRYHRDLDGHVNCRLFRGRSPLKTKNFFDLADGKKPFKDPATGQEVTRPYFDGLIFHRVIPNMIQGGCPKKNGFEQPWLQYSR